MAWPTKLGEAFNFRSRRIETWEVNFIRDAANGRRLKPSQHALQRAIDHGLTTADMLSIVLNGQAVEKDLPGDSIDRKPGLSFVGIGPSGILAKVKVTFLDGVGYQFVTIHPVEA